jgi:hypothetical protein
MNNTIRINKFNKLGGGSKKNKGGMGKGRGQPGRGPPGRGPGSGPPGRGIISNPGDKRVSQGPPGKEPPSSSPRLEPVPESKSDAFRSIYVINKNLPENNQINEVQELLQGPYSYKCPKKDGTPGKRLLYLTDACINLLQEKDTNYLIQLQNNVSWNQLLKKLNYGDGLKEENEVEEQDEDEEESGKKGKESRSWWKVNGNENIAKLLNDLVNHTLFITLPNIVKDLPTQACIIASLWSIIMVKSMSDISQMGQLINYIQTLISNQEQIPVTNTIFDNIQEDAKVGFVSSDKICAGVSCLLIRSVHFLLQTLCTRKSAVGHKTTQNILVLKGEIAGLALCLNLFEEEYNAEIFNIFPSNSLDNVDFKYMMATIAFYYNEYVSKLDKNNTVEQEFYDLFYIKRDINDISIYKNDRFINLSNFIRGICTVLKSPKRSGQGQNLDLLYQISKYFFTLARDFRCRKWTYYIATDVFRLLYPQKEINFTNIKNIISYNEIRAATIDGTYGHDFAGLDCIQRLGEQFIKIAGSNYTENINVKSTGEMETSENEIYLANAKGYIDLLIPEGIKKDENEAIKRCLENSECVTIDQIEDDLLINFNSSKNYLTGETSIGNPQYWHFFDSLFSLKPLILAIDFTKGLQPYSIVAASQESVKSEKKSTQEFINPVNPNELQSIVAEQIKENGKGYELMGVNALFDGAASYGIYPKYIVNEDDKFIPYISETVINYTYTEGKGKKESKETNLIQVKFETTSELTKAALENKYKTSLIPSTFTPLDGVLDALLNLYDGNKQTLNNALETLDNRNNKYYVSFSKLWAELLNYKLNDKKINPDNELKVKLDKPELQNFIKGCKVYIKNNYKNNNIDLPPSLQDINDLIMNENVRNNLDYFKGVFNNCMALIIKNLVNPAISDDEKQQIISMFANAISFAKNNTASKRQIFGIKDDDENDIENVVENINTTEPTNIDNVIKHFFNTRKQDVFKRKPFESISSEFMESSGTPERRKGINDGKSASVAVMERQSGNDAKPKPTWLPGIGSGTEEVLTTLNQTNPDLTPAQTNPDLTPAQTNTDLTTAQPNVGTPLAGENLDSPLIAQNLVNVTTPPLNSNISVSGPFPNSTEAGSQDHFYRNLDTSSLPQSQIVNTYMSQDSQGNGPFNSNSNPSSPNPSLIKDTNVYKSQNMDIGGKRLKKTRRQRSNKNKKTKRNR